LRLRNLIFEQALIEYNPKKLELIAQRIEAYKAQDWEKYQELIDQTEKIYFGMLE
jgi:hypothetical protein